MFRRRLAVFLAASLLAFTPALGSSAAPNDQPSTYEISGTTQPQRTAIARMGIDIHAVHGQVMTVGVTPREANLLKVAGYRLTLVPPPSREELANKYHSYTETQQAVKDAVTKYPAIAQASSVGQSYEKRDIPILRLTGAGTGDKPEVLFNCNQHAREHLTAEMCLHIIDRYTSGYGSDAEITKMVDSRIIWIIPMVNPDGIEYDNAGGGQRGWRKNRQGPGTDLNRNWGFKWGCCGGSSGSTSSETYRGTAAFSAPETQVLRDFVNSRVVGGKQRITAHIDFHTYSELVLWPMGYTTADTTPEVNADQAKTFQTLGRNMAATNRYTPEQSSDLYITDGSIIDWMWATHKIWSYTFEMYPTGAAGGGFYPPASVIDRETARNDAAVAMMLSYADCVPRVIGKTC
ncbi:zinc carboxypeptidase [Pseudonocardiaceae bacterium YIM PH 21723]|nr:zinc carboxypeptidase [Pseudonocardiaceae bacterium YIM PH 21723]